MLSPGKRSAALRLLYDESMKHLREGLAPDVVRAKVYELRARLHLDVPADLVEETLLLAAEEIGQ